ncbi:hypothetical protein ACFLVC_05000 [Chloroflexota bacterium]
MELTTNLYEVGDNLKAIYDKLGTGIAIVAIQKEPGRDLGRGKTFSAEKPRLYISIDNGKLKLTKVKNWHNKKCNPNGMVANFRIENGCDFKIYQPLHHPEKEY